MANFNPSYLENRSTDFDETCFVLFVQLFSVFISIVLSFYMSVSRVTGT